MIYGRRPLSMSQLDPKGFRSYLALQIVWRFDNNNLNKFIMKFWLIFIKWQPWIAGLATRNSQPSIIIQNLFMDSHFAIRVYQCLNCLVFCSCLEWNWMCDHCRGNVVQMRSPKEGFLSIDTLIIIAQLTTEIELLFHTDTMTLSPLSILCFLLCYFPCPVKLHTNIVFILCPSNHLPD